jgi:site-specific DNA-cytosine methylase
LAQFIKTDARQHGVPQRRPRSYAVFWKDFAQLPKWELEHKKTPNIIGFLEKQLFEDKNYM